MIRETAINLFLYIFLFFFLLIKHLSFSIPSGPTDIFPHRNYLSMYLTKIHNFFKLNDILLSITFRGFFLHHLLNINIQIFAPPFILFICFHQQSFYLFLLSSLFKCLSFLLSVNNIKAIGAENEMKLKTLSSNSGLVCFDEFSLSFLWERYESLFSLLPLSSMLDYTEFDTMAKRPRETTLRSLPSRRRKFTDNKEK